MRNLLLITYLLLVLVTAAFLLFGVISFFSTLALYATLFIIAFSLINAFTKSRLPSTTKLNLKIAVASVLLTLCITDFALRYIIKPVKYLDHNEINGSWCYSSYPMRSQFRFITKHFYNFERENGALYINPPNKTKTISNSDFTYPHTYNSEGLRSNEIPLTKQKNEIRVIALGDSYTEGIGAPADSTWPALLQQQLQANGSKDTTYTVINAGVYGSDPFFEWYLLKARLLKYKPDIVIVATNNTDILDVQERGGFERFMPDSSVVLKNRPWWEPIYGASIIARMIVIKVFHYGYNFMPRAQYKASYLQASKTLATAITGLQGLAQQNNFKLVIIFHPALEELPGTRFNLDITKSLITDTSIRVIDLQRGFNNYFQQNNLNPKNYFWPHDTHPNSQGYLIFSRLLYIDFQKP